MNWILLAILAWLALGLETGLRKVLALGPGNISPSFVIPLVVVVALNAPPRAAAWAALLAGLVLDLLWRIPLQGGGTATIAGPYAIGCLLAAQLVLSMRGMVIPKNPLTVGVLSLLAAAITQIVVVGFMTARASYGDPIEWAATSELLTRLLGALYTGVVGLALGVVMLPISNAIAPRSHHSMLR